MPRLHPSRRDFVESALALAALALADLPASAADAALAAKIAGPSDKIRVATIGVNGQGSEHVGEWLKNPDVDLVAELRRCIDQCRGMNARSHRSRTIADMSASVTT